MSDFGLFILAIAIILIGFGILGTICEISDRKELKRKQRRAFLKAKYLREGEQCQH